MYGDVSQARLSLDNSGMLIFTASQPSLGLHHHFRWRHIVLQILPSGKTISSQWQLLAMSVFFLALPTRKGLWVTKQLTEVLKHFKSICGSKEQLENESSCRSLDCHPSFCPSVPLSQTTLSASVTFTAQTGSGSRPSHFGPRSSSTQGSLSLWETISS